ncbi:MAG: DUF4258 domain-containing protein [Chitinispirillaceae bacterium]|nr:DUF4258 domain-containing protein [Chitinispirillaceae bacterium]
MNCDNINFSSHAVQRMFERGIKKQSVVEVIKSGKIIDSYPDDDPYPSFLTLGFENNMPIHVVVAKDDKNRSCYVITVYLPKAGIWHAGFRERRES